MRTLAISLITIMMLGCSEDTIGPESRLPDNIVTLGSLPDGGGDVLMNIRPKAGEVRTYDLWNDLRIGGFYNISSDRSTGQVDFILISTTGVSDPIEVMTFDAANDRFFETTLDVGSDDYYWSSGTSSEDYFVLRGTSYEDTENSFISITDRDGNQQRVIDVCDECFWIGSQNPSLIKGDFLFTFYGDLPVNAYAFIAVDLRTGDIVYKETIVGYPRVLAGSQNLYRYESGSFEIHDQLDYSNKGSFESPYEMGFGIIDADNDRTVVLQFVAQPAVISSIPFVFDLGTEEVIQEFTLNELAGSFDTFEEATGYTLTNYPALIYVDVNRDFTLYQVSQYDTVLERFDYSYVYSDYNSKYRDHIDLPSNPGAVLLIDWD